MEKSKAGSYLERLEKWREERRNNNGSVSDGPSAKKAKVSGSSGTGQTGRKSSVCAVVPPRTQVQGKPRPQAVVIQVNRTTQSRRTTTTNSRNVSNNTKNASAKTKPILQGQNTDVPSMSQKLQEWKKQKAQKEEKKPTSGARKVSPAKPSGQFREVKSRLFDFERKPRPSLAKGKENMVKSAQSVLPRKPAEHNNMHRKPAPTKLPKKQPSKSVPTIQQNKQPSKSAPTIQQKKQPSKSVPTNKQTGSIDRRQSAVSHTVPKTPASILKRKSCVGSIDAIQGDNSNSATGDQRGDKSLPLGGDHAPTGTPHCVPLRTPGTASRSVRFISPDVNCTPCQKGMKKTPRTPASRRVKLNEWLKAKGKTPSKFRHLVCFHADNNTQEKAADPLTKSSITVDEMSEQMTVIEEERQNAEAERLMETMLDECSTLIEAGCPAATLLPILDNIYSQVPCAQSSARFYQCKASALRTTLDLDAILQVFAQATINNAQPKESLAKCLTETIKYVTEEQIKRVKVEGNPSRRSHVETENMFASSTIVYSVSNVTPLSESKKHRRRTATPVPACRVLTPVRRSTRRSLQNLPSSLRDTSERFYSLREVDETDRDNMLFRPNLALNTILGSDDETS